MATIQWPASLPKAPTLARTSETFPQLAQRSQMDVGVAKVRRRVTASSVVIPIELKLTGAQVGILYTFFVTTTKGGAEAFQWFHPRTGEPADFRFIDPPQVRPQSPRRTGAAEPWTATFDLELLPFVTPAATEAAPDSLPTGGAFFDHAVLDGEQIAATIGDDEQVHQALIFEADAAAPDFVLELISSVIGEPAGVPQFEEHASRTIGIPALERGD